MNLVIYSDITNHYNNISDDFHTFQQFMRPTAGGPGARQTYAGARTWA